MAIIIKGWREGMQKVSLTKLQSDLLEKSLKESKNNVDLLLDGNEIRIEIDNLDLAQEFVSKADKIRADCILEK
jgi:hypothetical protein